jgi:hypothetical protein
MQKLYWKGISNDDRIKAISEITNRIHSHGTILNFQKFSDVILSLVVEIEAHRINSLYERLGEILTLEGNIASHSVFTGIYILFIHITFSKSTGDLEIEIPNIPE